MFGLIFGLFLGYTACSVISLIDQLFLNSINKMLISIYFILFLTLLFSRDVYALYNNSCLKIILLISSLVLIIFIANTPIWKTMQIKVGSSLSCLLEEALIDSKEWE